MIGIDSNVLLRYLLQDDELQSRRATKLFMGAELIFVSHVVIAETAWTLAGKKYKASRSAIADAITALFEEENIVFQDASVVWSALADYRLYGVENNRSIDFPDALIYHASKDAAVYFEEDFDGFYTFDKQVHSLPDAHAP